METTREGVHIVRPPRRRRNGRESAADLVERLKPSAVRVRLDSAPDPAHEDQVTPTTLGFASGFFVTKDGYIATNAHVAEDETVRYVVTLSDGKEMDASVAYREQEGVDFALLKVKVENAPAVQYEKLSQIRPGERVIAFGQPLALGQQITVGDGIISSVPWEEKMSPASSKDALTITGAFITTTVPLHRGSSGGPMFDMRGKLVGMNNATTHEVDIQSRAGSIGLVIPADEVAWLTARALRAVNDNNRTAARESKHAA